MPCLSLRYHTGPACDMISCWTPTGEKFVRGDKIKQIQVSNLIHPVKILKMNYNGMI